LVGFDLQLTDLQMSAERRGVAEGNPANVVELDNDSSVS
jgi:hypothetical protein